MDANYLTFLLPLKHDPCTFSVYLCSEELQLLSGQMTTLHLLAIFHVQTEATILSNKKPVDLTCQSLISAVLVVSFFFF